MWNGIMVVLSFVGGMFTMYKFSEHYNARIRAAWQERYSKREEDEPIKTVPFKRQFVNSADMARMKAGMPVRKNLQNSQIAR